MTSSVEPSQLTSHLGFWLRFVSNNVSHAFARKMESRDITVAEWALMRQLYEADAISPSSLAEQMGLTRGAVTKLADRLLAKGFVVRAASPTDARAQTLALTSQGRALVPELSALADQNDAEFFDHFSVAERKHLEDTLKEIVRRRGLSAIPLS
jgi:DNA-binding MarR family transcriptional regulator